MLEDRIIVQDRGIDAGLAALMQNANKGSMDPAALLAMMNITVWAVMAAGGGSGSYCYSSVGVVMDLDLVVVMQVLWLLN